MVKKVEFPQVKIYYAAGEAGTNSVSPSTDNLPDLLSGSNEESGTLNLDVPSNQYTKTANANIYYNNADNKYYKWDNKKEKFIKMKDIDEIFPTGFYKDCNGNIYNTDGTLIIKNKDGRLYAYFPNGHEKWVDTGNRPRDYLAEAYGYSRQDKLCELFGNVYYDKDSKEYKRYNEKTQSFDMMQMVDYSTSSNGDVICKTRNGEYIKYFDMHGSNRGKHINVTEEEYLAAKGGYKKSDKYPNTYLKNVGFDYAYFTYNAETKSFDEFSDKIYREKMLDTKADGKIDDFWQGDTGDCWLLTLTKAEKNEYIPEQVRKNLEKALSDLYSVNDNGDVTVNMKGHKLPNGQYLKYVIINEEIDEKIKESIKSKEYSIGDKDPFAIELAVSKYSKRVSETRYNEFRHADGFDMDTYISGGHVGDAIGLLTGMQSTTVNKDGRILVNGINNSIYFSDKNTVNPLDENSIKEYMANNIVFASYASGNSNSHVISLAKIDDEYVWYYDSNIDTENSNKSASQLKKMKKEEFFAKLTSITYTDFSKPLQDTKEKRQYRSRQFGV